MVGVASTDSNNIVVYGQTGHYAVTHNGGINWLQQESKGPSNQYLLGIATYYSQTALIVGESADSVKSGKILKTIDGGNNWYLRHVCSSKLQKVAFARIQKK